MVHQTLFILVSAVFLSPAQAMPIHIGGPFMDERFETLVCHDPVELPKPFTKLTGFDRADLAHSPELLQKATSSLTVTLTTRAGSFDSDPSAHLGINGENVDRTLHFKSLTLSPVQLRIVRDQLKPTKEAQRRLLAVNPTYQVFLPNLVMELNAETAREILNEKEFEFLNWSLEQAEPDSPESLRLVKHKEQRIQQYLTNPREIYGVNQLQETFTGSPFAALVEDSFLVFVSANERAAFMLSRDQRQISYCHRAESSPTAAEDLKTWLTSKPILDLLSCKSFL